MEFTFELTMLSEEFLNKYPAQDFPELLHKQGRPYTCLLIDTHEDYLICVPFRTNIKHRNAFLFKGTKRSTKSNSGLDFSKMAIIKDSDYIESSPSIVVDLDEYNEMIKNLPIIVERVHKYIDAYIGHITGKQPLHKREFIRRYNYSTLKYFHEILLY